MGLWIKNDDGSIEKVAGSGGGGGGTFDGDHVLTGDVDNPPEELAVGQLMWDGVEGGGSGGGGDGGPHDHDYLPLAGGTLTGDLQVDGTITGFRLGQWSNNPDFVSLTTVGMSGSEYCLVSNGADTLVSAATGGLVQIRPNANEVGGVIVESDKTTIRNDLQVDGTVLMGGTWDGAKISNNQSASREIFSIGDLVDGGSQINLYGPGDANSPGTAYIYSGGSNSASFDNNQNTKLYGDLQVDGVTTVHGPKGFHNLSELVSPPADHWTAYPGVWGGYGMHAGTQGGYMTSMTNNGYRNADGTWKSLGVNGQVGAAQIDLAPTGHFYVRTASNHPTGSSSSPLISFTVTDTQTTVNGDLQVSGAINGTLTFGIAPGIDTADVLERAETATMPVVDEEGVATTDAEVESITVNEVVTALLAKVKELSAEIEELKAKDRPLKKQAAPRKKAATRKTTAKKKDT